MWSLRMTEAADEALCGLSDREGVALSAIVATLDEALDRLGVVQSDFQPVPIG